MGKRYEFGEFILDTQEGWLSRANVPVKATPRQLALLEALVERRGRLVEKKEILDRVWEGTTVGEANLTVQMSKLRRLLGETEDQPFIETVPTRGYRFLLPVRVLPPAATEALPLRRPVPAPEPEVAPAAAAPGAVATPVAPGTPVAGPPAPAADTGRRPTAPRPGRWWAWALAAVLILVAGWAAISFRSRQDGAATDGATRIGAPGAQAASGPDATVDASGIRRLTSNAADDWEPAVSPDGRTVAFVSNRAGAPAIHLLALDRPEAPPVRVPTRGPAGAPAWSPDGSRLAFVCQRDGQADICTVGRDGAGERVVAGEPGDELQPAWSPDGRRLAYSAFASGSWELRMVDADGEGARPRRAGPAGWSMQMPAWSPDGTRLAVARRRSAADHDIWIVPIDRAAPTAVVESDEGKTDPAWSPDGGRLAYVTRDGIVVVDVAAGKTTRVPSTRRGDRHPSWSKDGRSLVIGSSREGNSELFLIAVEE
jgi:TolB protein